MIDVRYGKDGALNPASNNHYELGTAPLSLARSKLAETGSSWFDKITVDKTELTKHRVDKIKVDKTQS